MEWALLFLTGLGVAGWLVAWRYWRITAGLKRLLVESIALTQTAINQNQHLIEDNQAILTDLTVATTIINNSGMTVTKADTTTVTTLH